MIFYIVKMKVLCFTPSYKRFKMLRGCVQDIATQSYDNIFHSINITLDSDDLKVKDDFNVIFDDLKSDKNSFIFTLNQHQQINHMRAIMGVDDYESYDIFVKIDDDDIYKKDYVKKIVEYFKNNDVDVLSSKMKYQLNGELIRRGDYNNLGANPKNCDFKMPPTFSFNRKAFDLIKNINHQYGFEDNMWRDMWCGKCNIDVFDNTDNVIWNIHGKNVSTSSFLITKK
jgi:hypothetical protein